jgi:thiol-disulfide isomerase/thioredoxin
MPLPAQYKTINTLKPEELKSDIPRQKEIQGDRNNYISSKGIVCIYLSAKWCEPCKKLSPKFDELALKYNSPENCMVIKEDIDQYKNPDYNVGAIPAFIFYKDGKLLRNPNGSPFDIVGGNLVEVEKVLNQLLPQK